MIGHFTFKGPKPGPALLVFGAVHGNEPCGTQAIRRVMKEVRTGKIKLQKGSVTFVPVCNPYAFAKKARFVEENLNRIMRRTKKPRSKEAKLANELCDLVAQADALLDLHSTTSHGRPFIYLDYPTARNRAFARSLGAEMAVTGWPQLYKKLGRRHLSYDSTTCAAAYGADGLILECGQHDAASSPRMAYRAIRGALRHYGLTGGEPERAEVVEIKMSAAYFRMSAQDRLAVTWKHFARVKKGAPLIRHAGGKTTRAPYDAVVIMPKPTAEIGQDWLYLGRIR